MSFEAYPYIDGLVQDCCNSSALAMELLQPCTKQSTWQVSLQLSCGNICQLWTWYLIVNQYFDSSKKNLVKLGISDYNFSLVIPPASTQMLSCAKICNFNNLPKLQIMVSNIKSNTCQIYKNKRIDSLRGMIKCRQSGLILGLRPANERRRYFVTMSFIGWVQT